MSDLARAPIIARELREWAAHMDHAADLERIPRSHEAKLLREAAALLVPAAAALAEPGDVAEAPYAHTAVASRGAAPSPGSSNAAVDERPVDHRIPGSQTANPAGSPKVARTFDLDAAADEPGETPA